jgi:hypothetical protein
MKKVIGGIIVITAIIFIWHNSLQDAKHSEYASLSLVYFVQPILGKLGITVSVNLLDAVLRKMAHLSEFTLLGFVLFSTCSFFPVLNKRNIEVTITNWVMCSGDR